MNLVNGFDVKDINYIIDYHSVFLEDTDRSSNDSLSFLDLLNGLKDIVFVSDENTQNYVRLCEDLGLPFVSEELNGYHHFLISTNENKLENIDGEVLLKHLNHDNNGEEHERLGELLGYPEESSKWYANLDHASKTVSEECAQSELIHEMFLNGKLSKLEATDINALTIYAIKPSENEVYNALDRVNKKRKLYTEINNMEETNYMDTILYDQIQTNRNYMNDDLEYVKSFY